VIAHPFARSQPPPPRTYLSTATVYSCCDRGPPSAALPPPSCALGADCTVPHLNPRHRRTSACPRFVQNFPLTQLFVFLLFYVFKAVSAGPGYPVCPFQRPLHSVHAARPPAVAAGSNISPMPSSQVIQHPPMTARGSALPPFPRTTGDPLHSPLSSLTQILRPAFSSPFPSPPR